MSPKHGPRPPGRMAEWRTRVADRFFKVVTPERAKIVTWALGAAAVILVVLTCFLALVNIEKINSERTDRRAQVNAGMCAIIGVVPDGIPQIDTARKTFKCGPYKPNVNNQPTPGSVFDPSRSASHSPAAPSSSASPTPGATAPTATRTEIVPTTVSGPTITRTTSHTATATRTVTRTPRPSRSSTGVLPITGCSLIIFGVRLC